MGYPITLTKSLAKINRLKTLMPLWFQLEEAV